MTPNDQIDQSQLQIAHLAVKFPRFWKCNLILWFHWLEVRFSLAMVICEKKYNNHLVVAVDADLLISVSDVVVNIPDADPYEALKKRLFENHSESKSSKNPYIAPGFKTQ